MSNINPTTHCVASYQTPCGVFQAHWFPYGETKYFAPVLTDTRTRRLYRAVIPHHDQSVAFVPAHKRASHTSPFVRRHEDIEVGNYNAVHLLAEFARSMRGVA